LRIALKSQGDLNNGTTTPPPDPDMKKERPLEKSLDAVAVGVPDNNNLQAVLDKRLWDLCGAVNNNHVSDKEKKEKIKNLIQNGASPNATFGFNKCTALARAAAHSATLTHILIENGADPNPPLPEENVYPTNVALGNSPLHTASENRNPLICRILLHAGADPNRGQIPPLTLVTKAAKAGLGNEALDAQTKECIDVLLNHGANPNGKCQASESDPSYQGEQGWGPLHYLCTINPNMRWDPVSHLEWIKTLIDHGADPYLKSKKGLSPLANAKNMGIPVTKSLMDIFEAENRKAIKKFVRPKKKATTQQELSLPGIL
jgi:ankyrin repeat protein